MGDFRLEARERKQYLQRIEELFTERIATVVYGVRRAGKSTLTAMLIDRLITSPAASAIKIL